MHAGIEDLERGRDVGGGIEHVEERAVGAGERLVEHEGQLGLDAQAEEALARDDGAVAVEHVVEQDAEIGLGDADGTLHGLRGEADLVPLDDAAVALLQGHPRVLDGIGVVDRHARVLERELAAGDARALRLVEPERGGLELLGLHAHAFTSSRCTTFFRTPTPDTSISTASPACRNFGGSKRMPAPIGVPVAITSPGSRVVKVERYEIR